VGRATLRPVRSSVTARVHFPDVIEQKNEGRRARPLADCMAPRLNG